MFEFDKIKNWIVYEIIIFFDFKCEELEVFVEFCYVGECMFFEKLKKYVMFLYCVVDKYEIFYLWDLCRNYIMLFINVLNVVEILEFLRLFFDKIFCEFVNNYIDFYLSMIFFLGRFRI